MTTDISHVHEYTWLLVKYLNTIIFVSYGYTKSSGYAKVKKKKIYLRQNRDQKSCLGLQGWTKNSFFFFFNQILYNKMFRKGTKQSHCVQLGF